MPRAAEEHGLEKTRDKTWVVLAYAFREGRRKPRPRESRKKRGKKGKLGLRRKGKIVRGNEETDRRSAWATRKRSRFSGPGEGGKMTEHHGDRIPSLAREKSSNEGGKEQSQTVAPKKPKKKKKVTWGKVRFKNLAIGELDAKCREWKQGRGSGERGESFVLPILKICKHCHKRGRGGNGYLNLPHNIPGEGNGKENLGRKK